MVAKRRITLTFSWGVSTHDDDGYPTGPETPTTLAVRCRPEPTGRRTLKALAPNGNYVEVRFVCYADPFTDTLPKGAQTSYLGNTYKVLDVIQYQKNAEIWIS